jgi:hypothetical protein
LLTLQQIADPLKGLDWVYELTGYSPVARMRSAGH